MTKRKSTGSRIDARHALKLVDVMDDSTRRPQAEREERASVAVDASVPAPKNCQRKAPAAHCAKGRMTKTAFPLFGERAEITEISPQEGSAIVLVSVTVYGAPKDRQGERYTLRLLTLSCEELSLAVGEIFETEWKALESAEALCRAVIKSTELLGYGSMSRRRLEQKLTARGFSREISSRAVEYMAARGYLDDADAAERFARRGVDKLWGPRRIKEDLFARGFTAEVIENTLSDLEDVDFAANCAAVIRKKYGGVPKDMPARRKLAAALVRQGYTSEHINRAVRGEVD